jgi:hypothetical protein
LCRELAIVVSVTVVPMRYFEVRQSTVKMNTVCELIEYDRLLLYIAILILINLFNATNCESVDNATSQISSYKRFDSPIRTNQIDRPIYQ